VLPALLVGLVGLLATLQYQWLGKVSEAEREQLRRSLTQRAREFADDFDLEISRAYETLQLNSGRDVAVFSAGFDKWSETARFPQMIRGVYLAELRDGACLLRRYDRGTRGFSDSPTAPWPAHLEPMLQQVVGRVRKDGPPAPVKTQIIAITLTPVFPDVPALVIPLPSRSVATLHATPADARSLTSKAGIDLRGSFLVIDLDGEYLRRTVVPALAVRHFPERTSDPYRVAILSAAGDPIFERGFAPGRTIDPDRADASASFFTLRPDVARDFASNAATFTLRATPPPGTASGLGAALESSRVSVVVQQRSPDTLDFSSDSRSRAGVVPQPGQFLRIVRPGAWRVVLQHESGSLDVAVMQARRRNLALSFGILAILAVGIGLIVLNARRSEQLAARQMDFVASVTHELRTPLAVIRSAAQNLSAGVVSDPAQAKRYGDLVEAEGQRLTETIEQVLEYAGLAGNRRPRSARPLDVTELVAGVVESLRPAIEAEGIAISVETTTGGRNGPMVVGDEAALGRVLHNLLTNAIKHGADGRWVGVSVAEATNRGRPEVRITVSDRGRGISSAELAHIFEPFYRGQHTADRQIHGNGIGLSLVQRIVESHGGRVGVMSAVGKGASFTVHLPVEESAAGPEPAVEPRA
jgi:two-component system sensor histidine kinase SenX3